MPTLEYALIGRARSGKPFSQLVRTYSIVLMGCDRHLRINFFFNRLTNCRASGSIVTHLQHWLRQNLGPSAIGIKVGDIVYKTDEELMRDNLLKTNEAYYVVYEDYTPSYRATIESPPIYARSVAELPCYGDDTGIQHRAPRYFEEWVYYTAVPLIRKSIELKLSFGRRATIELNNKQTAFHDNFRHALLGLAGYKARGIALDDGTILSSDAILFDDRVTERDSYRVVYGTTISKLARPIAHFPAQDRNIARARHSRDSARDSLRRISSSTSRTLHRVSSSTSRTSAQITQTRADKRRAEISPTNA